MKTANIKLRLDAKTSAFFNEYRESYRALARVKLDVSDADEYMKEARQNWVEVTPEFDEADGKLPVAIIDEDGDMVAKFSKARVTATTDKAEYIRSVLQQEGASKPQINTVVGLLRTSGLLDEISIGVTLAKKQHPEEYADATTEEAKGSRTVKFT